MSGATIVGCDLSSVTIADSWLIDADISGEVRGLTINGVEVEPLIEAELDRRHPERTRLRPTDVAGLRTAFDVVEEMWEATVARARRLPPDTLHERVAGEFSFVETQRHLLRATDGWLLRMVMQVPDAYHEWGLPPDLSPDAPPDSGPGLDEVLAVRDERLARVRAHLAMLADDDLTTVVDPPDATGHPQAPQRVLDCFRVVLKEEWWHHRYATRDLAVLERTVEHGGRDEH